MTRCENIDGAVSQMARSWSPHERLRRDDRPLRQHPHIETLIRGSSPPRENVVCLATLAGYAAKGPPRHEHGKYLDVSRNSRRVHQLAQQYLLRVTERAGRSPNAPQRFGLAAKAPVRVRRGPNIVSGPRGHTAWGHKFVPGEN